MLNIRPLIIVAFLTFTATHVYGQANEMWVRVKDFKGVLMPKVGVCTNAHGDGCRMDSAARVRINLPDGTATDSEIELILLNQEYLLIDPWNNKVRVPANRAKDVIVTVFRVGDPEALESDIVVEGLLSMINYKTQASGRIGQIPMTIDPRKAALSLVARNSGYTAEELDRRIRLQMQRAKAGEQGQYALYVGDFTAAEKAFLLSQKKGELDRREHAKDAFFLGQARLRLGKIQAAEKSFLDAQAFGMADDTSLLDYLGAVTVMKGDGRSGLAILEKSLSLQEKAPENHPELLASRVKLVPLYALLEREGEVQEQLQKIWLTCEASLSKNFAITAPALTQLIMIYQGLDEGSDSRFNSEIRWLKDLLDAAANKELRNQRSSQAKSAALLIQLSTELLTDDDPLYDKEVEEKALALIAELRNVVTESSRGRKNKIPKEAVGRRRVRTGFMGPALTIDSETAVFTMVSVLKLISDEKTAKQLRNEIVAHVKKTINKDPVVGLYAITRVAPTYLAEGSPEAESIYQLMWTTAANSSALENPLLATDFFDAALTYYLREVKVEEIERLFARVEDISKKARGTSHGLDAGLFVALSAKLRSLDEVLEELVRKLLETPINHVLQYAAEDLNDLSDSKLYDYVQIARVASAFGKHAEAKALFSMIRNKVEDKWGSLHLIVRECLSGIVEVEQAKELKDDAELTFRQLLANERRRPVPNKEFLASLLEQFADFLEESGKQEEADKLSAESEAMKEELERTRKANWLQKTYKERKEVDEIEATHRNDPKLIPLFESLAEAYSEQANLAESKVFYEKLLAAYERSPEAKPYDKASALDRFAQVLEKLNRDKEAEDRYLQGIALMEPLVANKDFSSWFMPYILERYASLLNRTGREAKAAEVMERVKALKKRK